MLGKVNELMPNPQRDESAKTVLVIVDAPVSSGRTQKRHYAVFISKAGQVHRCQDSGHGKQ